jgi:hypothetical protein
VSFDGTANEVSPTRQRSSAVKATALNKTITDFLNETDSDDDDTAPSATRKLTGVTKKVKHEKGTVYHMYGSVLNIVTPPTDASAEEPDAPVTAVNKPVVANTLPTLVSSGAPSHKLDTSPEDKFGYKDQLKAKLGPYKKA